MSEQSAPATRRSAFFDSDGRLSQALKERIALAMFFSLGFVAWGMFSLSVGIHFHNLDFEQYAVASFFSFIYSAVAIGVAFMVAGMSALLLKDAPPSWDRAEPLEAPIQAIRFANFGMLAVAIVAAGLVWGHIIAPPPIPTMAIVLWALFMIVVEATWWAARMASLVLLVWRFFFGIITVLAMPLVFVALMLALEPPKLDLGFGALLIFLPATMVAASPPFRMRRAADKTGPALDRDGEKPFDADWPIEVYWQQTMMPLAFTFFLVSASVGFVFLPNFPTQLGGAEPHDALFVMRPDELDNETRQALFHEDTWSSHQVEKSKRLTVIFQSDDWFFVRIAPDIERGDRSYEIRKDTVAVVQWY